MVGVRAEEGIFPPARCHRAIDRCGVGALRWKARPKRGALRKCRGVAMGAINVIVTYSSGAPKRRARVRGEVPGILGGMTREIVTDDRGHAMISWSSGSSHLSTIYIDGKAYPGEYYSGGSYAFPAS